MRRPNLAFTLSLPLSRLPTSLAICPSRTLRLPTMTLQPQDSSYREERDRRAIESEFLMPAPVTGEVDDDMAMLRERIQMLGRKEKQWAEVVQQFTSMSMLTGIPFIDPDTGEPTARAWVFVTLSAAVPLYVLFLATQWLHLTSVSFSQIL